MRAVVQRVTSSKVVVDGQITGAINKGINVLIGISCDDNEEDLKYIRDKIINLRIFEDENFKMNKSLMDIGGEILVISQFTLYGDCRKGRRPNFMAALGGEKMSRKRGIGLVVVVAVICSVLSSFLTVVVLKNNLGFSSSTTSGTQSISINSSGKSTNVYQAVTEKAMPSVVGITTTTISRDNMFSIATESEGVGTGIIVDSNGYILTNSHVISDGEARSVNVLFNDGSSIDGQVLWHDAQLDLAVVKVNKTGLTPAELGDSDEVRIGDIAIAIGNPLGLELQRTVTQGIISGLDRTIKTQTATMTGLIQTDASINSGNSGGPLLNEKGQVIGINTAKTSEGESLGFAISINQAKSIIESVIKDGSYEKVTLGIRGYDASTYAAYVGSQGQEVATDEGVYVGEVVSGSAAEKAGVKSGDIIVKIGNTKLASMSDLTKCLYTYKSGDSTSLVVNRDGKEVKLNVAF